MRVPINFPSERANPAMSALTDVLHSIVDKVRNFRTEQEEKDLRAMIENLKDDAVDGVETLIGDVEESVTGKHAAESDESADK